MRLEFDEEFREEGAVQAGRQVVQGPAPPSGQGRLVLQQLLLRLRDGDETALEPLIRETQGMAFRLARTVLRDTHACQDAVQDAYLIVYREIGRLRDPGAFRTWFARIVLNRCRRMLRHQPARSLEDLTEAETPSTPTGADTVEQRYDLRRALATLTETNRSVLMLREVMQFSYEEIAEALSIPLGTVKSRLADARRRLLLAWEGPSTPPGGGGPSGHKRTAVLLFAFLPALLGRVVEALFPPWPASPPSTHPGEWSLQS